MEGAIIPPRNGKEAVSLHASTCAFRSDRSLPSRFPCAPRSQSSFRYSLLYPDRNPVGRVAQLRAPAPSNDYSGSGWWPRAPSISRPGLSSPFLVIISSLLSPTRSQSPSSLRFEFAVAQTTLRAPEEEYSQSPLSLPRSPKEEGERKRVEKGSPAPPLLLLLSDALAGLVPSPLCLGLIWVPSSPRILAFPCSKVSKCFSYIECDDSDCYCS